MSKTALIIGAGPAGLTAAYELLQRTDIQPIVLEKTAQIGGIAQTARYKGNRIDIGGHRFFSKSDRVMKWWMDRLPLYDKQDDADADVAPEHHKPSDLLTPEPPDEVMLVRSRLSRIYFLRKFFSYPLKANFQLVRNLGLGRLIACGCSYCYIGLFPLKNEENLEQFFINRFGRRLYETFFKSYTEKVWGCPCHEISSSWGAQRIKGLSIGRALLHAMKWKKKSSIEQKDTETSLIERFMYPKYGPGQIWEMTAQSVLEAGCRILMEHEVIGLECQANRVTRVRARDCRTGQETSFDVDYVFSSMPVKHLVQAMGPSVPQDVQQLSQGLVYRDFLTVGLLLEKMSVYDRGRLCSMIDDNWIYIQEPDVKLARLQIFNNWSPYLLVDPSKTWVGLEYFCNMTDAFWNMPDPELIDLASRELVKIQLIDEKDVLDGVVIRMEKAYPAYFGTYNRFDEIRQYLDQFENLFLIGRNGMHRYNNQDHSMLTAMVSVDNIIAGRTDKNNIWDVNTEKTYHEAK